MQSIEVYKDQVELARAAASHFMEVASRAQLERGCFSVVMAGGSSPKETYALLTTMPMDWENIHVFWGDERCVPPDHPDSNYAMAKKVLLDHVNIPLENIHRMRGELIVDQAAQDYEKELRNGFPEVEFPVFDLILLGLGSDGHTASLFPGSQALGERKRWVMEVAHRHPPEPLVDRVTLTLPVINAARQVTFIVSGAGKADRLRQVVAPQEDDGRPALPAQLVQPVHGELLWLVDEAAGVQEKH
jgi:6-phosphogluconolactonase